MRIQLSIKHRLIRILVLTLLGLGLADRAALPNPPSIPALDRQQAGQRPIDDGQQRPFKTALRPDAIGSAKTGRDSVTLSPTDFTKDTQPKYAFRRGQEFALDVQLGSESKTDARWSGRPYLRVLYSHQNQMPALVMVVGKLECLYPTAGGWGRFSGGDIKLPAFLWVTERGSLTTTLATSKSPHKLPHQMSAIFPYEELLVPSLPNNTESYHRSGSATHNFGAAGELTGATKMSIDLTRNIAGYRVVRSHGFYCVEKELGLKLEQVTIFDPRDSMLINSTLNYSLHLSGDFTVTATMRRLGSDELASARNAVVDVSPKQELPKFLGRVPVELDQIPKHYPKHGSELRQGERVLCCDALVVENNRLIYWFYGRLVMHLDARRALIRLDGSDEFVEANYSLLKRCP